MLLLALACACTFSNTLHNTFHLDDYFRVSENPEVTRLWPLWRHFVDPRTMSTLDRITQFRPLLPLSLTLNYAVAGHSLVGYHLVNIAIHCAAAIFSFFLVREGSTFFGYAGSRRNEIAFFTALLFSIHPIAGVPVNYICARDLLMMQMFLSASLYAYFRFRNGGSKFFLVLAVLFHLLSILSKTNSVMLPFLVGIAELTARTAGQRKLHYSLPFLLVSASYFAYTHFVLRFSDLEQVVSKDAEGRHYGYFLTQAKAHLFEYLYSFVWPFGIRMAPFVPLERSLTPSVLAGLIFILTTLVLALYLRTRAPVSAFCIAAYWIMMMPESSFVPFIHTVVYYRAYPPALFLFWGISSVLLDMPRSKSGTIVLSMLSIYFASVTYGMNRIWLTEESLWSHSVKYGADELAHLNLAMGIENRKDPRVRENLEEALRRNPNYILANINLGLLYIELGRKEDGFRHLFRARDLNPGRAQTHYWIGQGHQTQGQIQEARRSFERAADLDTRNLSYQIIAAKAALHFNEYERSLFFLNRIIQVDENFEDAKFLEGFSLQMLGRREEAILAYRKFLEVRPRHNRARFNLALALKDSGNCQEAIPVFVEVLDEEPGHKGALYHLPQCIRSQKALSPTGP